MLDEVILTTEVAIGALFLAIAIFLAVTLVRRRLIAGSTVPSLCALRLADSRWRSGLLKLTAQTLEWYPLFGLFPRPRFVWLRRSLELAEAATSDTAEARGALVGVASPVRVAVVADDPRAPAVFELALASGAYTALRAWLEAAPPTDRRFET